MNQGELVHWELSAEIDEVAARLAALAEQAPAWPPARGCQRMLARLQERTRSLRTRLDAPLIVALLGGTGTGKSSLVNALCGVEVTPAGRQRPTTLEPVLVAPPGLLPEQLGIDPAQVRLVSLETPRLGDVVLIDCPDPDTTEDDQAQRDTNLARLRTVAAHCDVLLVTGTQQKYRDARVLAELAAAAPGARLVFVQTHADTDDDIREDWRKALGDDYQVGQMFLLDVPAAWAAAQQGLPAEGEFARLHDLFTHELARSAAHRIRRANFLDLAQATLALCAQRTEVALPAVEQLEQALAEQRSRLAQKLAARMHEELAGSRRQWERRLAAEVASRWGASPFAWTLWAAGSLGGLLTGAALFKARTPAQMALWGAVATGRTWQKRRQDRVADTSLLRVSQLGWHEQDLRTAAVILEGYAHDAWLPAAGLEMTQLAQQAQEAGQAFTAAAGSELQSLVRRLALRHAAFRRRAAYELLQSLILMVVLLRWAKNFFYDSWLANPPQDLLDLRFFVHGGLWILLASAVLVTLFSRGLRRGLEVELSQLAERWSHPAAATALFAPLEQQARAAKQFHDELLRLQQSVTAAQQRLAAMPARLGQRLSPH